MVPVSARERLHACAGAGIAGRAALTVAGLRADELDLVELYSCFPIAVQAYAGELGLPLTRDLTVTGGMPFAGGPYNNYVLQATARAAELLRAGKGRTALVASVSGVLTKQGFGVWGTEARAPFARADVSDEVARRAPQREVLETYSGVATVAGCTVLHGRDKPPRGVLLVDTPDGRRAMATSEDSALIAALEREEFVGRNVTVSDNEVKA